MKKNSIFILSAIVGFAVIFATTAIYAGTEVLDEIKMENPAYKEHKKSITMFTHKKHAEVYAKDYPEFYKKKCGECHHDEDNKPLENLKAGDDVKNCIECHSKPGEVDKKTKAKWKKEKVKKAEKDKLSRQWHAEAIHDNCRGCHKSYNKKNKTKAAPTTCAKCHPKKTK
jgi:hypothetical protein